MPDLIEKGYVYIAKPPLYRLRNGKQETYVEKESELEELLLRDKLEQFEIADAEGKKHKLTAARWVRFNRRFNEYLYPNQVDNYQQDHYQLHYALQLTGNWLLNSSLHYTYGRGYFEQYRYNDRLSTYGIVVMREPIRVALEEVDVLILGGSATLEKQAPDARSEAIIALVGPIVSLLLAAALLAFWFVTRQASDAAGVLLSASAWWLGLGNLLLGGFNLLPAFPMDGGRLVRAALWGATRDFLRATRLASYVGRLLAYGMIALGLALVLAEELILGVWLALIGWFLNRATESAYRRVELGMLVEDLHVRDVMEQDVAVVGPNLTIDTLIEQHQLGGQPSFYPVTMDGELVGTVDIRQARRVPRNDWAATRVTDVMSRGERMLTVTEPLSVMDAMLRLDQSGAPALPVVAENEPRRLLGVVTREGLIRAIRRQATLRQEGAAR
jgi:Zn-dependent protease/predicted transcriptional regulator